MKFRVLLVAVVGCCTWSVSAARSCPFCSAVSQTFSEEIASMDVVVVATLQEAPPRSSSSDSFVEELPKSKFVVIQVIKGDQWTKESSVIEALYFGEAKIGEKFLIMGADPPNVMWSTPLALSDRAREYVSNLGKLPSGTERLAFFMNYLEDEDEMLARDAYDEFAKASYKEVRTVKDRMNHDQLVEWIKNDDVPASRRRLYLTMLGICGTADDTVMLEEMLQASDGSPNRSAKAGLDAMIACYLTLKGTDGMPLIEEQFLKNTDAEYPDTYSAIMALRFHGTETDVVPRQRLIAGLRHMLDRPQLADLVIPDLARWEDWEVMPRLVQLFKDADENSSWVRVPVINFLRACPLPEAKEQIALLSEIDPNAVKRANTFFPFAAAPSPTATTNAAPSTSKPNGADSKNETETVLIKTVKPEESQSPPSPRPAEAQSVASAETTSSAEEPANTSSPGADGTDSTPAVSVAQETPAETVPERVAIAAGDPSTPAASEPDGVSTETGPAANGSTAVMASGPAINMTLVFAVLAAIAILLFVILWAILRGANREVKP